MLAPEKTEMSATAQICWCGFYATGLIGTLVVSGVLQERIMTVPYDGELFGNSVYVVFLNRVGAFIFSAVMSLSTKDALMPQAPMWMYFTVSLSNVGAAFFNLEVLKYVSFSVLMLGKSFKMMPVMVWSMAILGTRYSSKHWLVATVVTLGVAEFILTGSTVSPNNTGSSFRGYVFLFLFLALDGLTSSMQENMFTCYRMSKYNQMTYVTFFSLVFSFIPLVTTSKLVPCVAFTFAHRAFMRDVLILSVVSVASQSFIFSLVKEFGALVFAATMNVRQMASICVSNVRFKHKITLLQVLGLVTVFLALFYKSFGSFMAACREQREPMEATALVHPRVVKSEADIEEAHGDKAS